MTRFPQRAEDDDGGRPAAEAFSGESEHQAVSSICGDDPVLRCAESLANTGDGGLPTGGLSPAADRLGLRSAGLLLTGVSSLIGSGVAVGTALMSAAESLKDEGVRNAAAEMSAATREGRSMADCMSKHPRFFPRHVVAAVRSAELGGFLPEVLGELGLDYELRYRAMSLRLRGPLVYSWWYGAAGVVLLAICSVIWNPSSVGQSDASRVIGYIGHREGPYIGALAVTALVLGALLRGTQGRLALDWVRAVAPWVREETRSRALAGFLRLLSRLQSAGVSPTLAWRTSLDAVENRFVFLRLQVGEAMVRGGAGVSAALAATGLMADTECRQIAIDEGAGRVDESLQRLALQYQESALLSAGRWWGFLGGLALLANALFLGAAIVLFYHHYYLGMFRFLR